MLRRLLKEAATDLERVRGNMLEGPCCRITSCRSAHDRHHTLRQLLQPALCGPMPLVPAAEIGTSDWA